MGTSNWQNISYCIDIIRRINPRKILDVGFGFGRWGMISREFLELWNNRIHSKDWVVQVDGVEIFAPNIEDYHKYFYSNIFNLDASYYIKSTEHYYDLIILGDVLEHFEKNNGEEFLKECLRKTKYVMLNIPLGNGWEQAERYGNKYEAHLSSWSIKELRKFNIITRRIFRDNILRRYGVFILSATESRIPSNSEFNYAVRLHLKKLLKM